MNVAERERMFAPRPPVSIARVTCRARMVLMNIKRWMGRLRLLGASRPCH